MQDGAYDWEVRTHIYSCLAATGVAPSAVRTAADLGIDVGQVEEANRRLAADHALALMPGSGDIWMAHPFSARPTGYRVVAETGSWWANCAWDALAIPPMLGVDAAIETGCPDCGHAFDLRVDGGELVGDDGVVQFVVPPSEFWDDIGFT